jgi:diguanylate cyclase (GGDEF)-like protein
VAGAVRNRRHARPAVPDGYRRLARVLRSLVDEQSVDAVLARIATDLRQLVPCQDVVIWELLDGERLAATLIDGEDEEEMAQLTIRVGEGITGSAVFQQQLITSDDAHLDVRAGHVPGTTHQAEAILCVPLTARTVQLGALSLYRRGRNRSFTSSEIELARQFADIAAIALHNAHTLAEFQRLALTDELTGLANRRRFQEELRRQAAAVRRHGRPLSLLLLDVDNFKDINDRWGHTTGDTVLREIAEALRRRLRAYDLAARIGGDEFAVLLPQTTETEAAAVAADLTRDLERSQATRVRVRASVGCATCSRGKDAMLFADADRALYTAKAAARSGETATTRR